jgi:hypothetical protein
MRLCGLVRESTRSVRESRTTGWRRIPPPGQRIPDLSRGLGFAYAVIVFVVSKSRGSRTEDHGNCKCNLCLDEHSRISISSVEPSRLTRYLFRGDEDKGYALGLSTIDSTRDKPYFMETIRSNLSGDQPYVLNGRFRLTVL